MPITVIMMHPMRTTVTLDAEAERLLKDAMRRHGHSFKQALNRAVIRGLAGLDADGDEIAFEVRASPMGLRTGHDPASLNRLNDDLEAEAFLALSARLERRAGNG